MAIGPGKYDDIALELLRAHDAFAAIVGVYGRDGGAGGCSGCSIKFAVREGEDLRLYARLVAATLRETADRLERDAFFVKKGS